MGVTLSGENEDGQLVNVQIEGKRLGVNSLTPEQAAVKAGEGFQISAVDPSAAVGTIIFYLKNNHSKKDLVIDRLVAGGIDAISWIVSSCHGIAAGSTAMPINNRLLGGPTDLPVLSRGEGPITGTTVLLKYAELNNIAIGSVELLKPGSLILPPGTAINVEADVAAGTLVASVVCDGHFE